jgi:hypothetical protein
MVGSAYSHEHDAPTSGTGFTGTTYLKILGIGTKSMAMENGDPRAAPVNRNDRLASSFTIPSPAPLPHTNLERCR